MGPTWRRGAGGGTQAGEEAEGWGQGVEELDPFAVLEGPAAADADQRGVGGQAQGPETPAGRLEGVGELRVITSATVWSGTGLALRPRSSRGARSRREGRRVGRMV